MSRARLALLLGLMMVSGVIGCGRPAQIGADRDAFKAVDALFTAVSLREGPMLDDCERTLEGLHASGKLPDSAFQALESIISEARGGRWDDAQDRLRTFMLGQNR